MTARVATVAFQGVEAVPVDVQAQFLSGQVNFHIVGLADKAISESKERVRAALHEVNTNQPFLAYGTDWLAFAHLVIALAGAPIDLLASLPLALLCLPGAWLVSRRGSIAVKVAASWLIAVALLAISLQMAPVTPGYRPDHMD